MANQSLAPLEKRNVLIFHVNLIAYSETFIPAQAEKYKIFTPFYAGFRRVNGLGLPKERTVGPVSSRLLGDLRDWGAIFGHLDPWFTESIRKIQPQLIHAHFVFGGVRAIPLAHRLNIPLIVTCHGVDVTSANNQWSHRPLLGEYFLGRKKKLLAAASLFIGVSRFICDQMLQRGFPADKVRLHYIGVDTDQFQPDPSVAKEPMILFVGRLVEKKGVAYLLRAMKQVNAKYPDVKFNIMGDGPLRKQLETYAREEKLNVQFYGVQKPEVIQQYLKAALMLCMVSVRAQDGDSEGLGIVNLEAQAVGIPVVGTLHGGIPEAVKNGVTGLLSPERDVDALAENIMTLLSDTNLRTTMGLAARKHVVDNFDLKNQSALLEKIYLEILER